MAAPRAVAASPSAWASPWIAVGAMATGEATGVPSTVVAVDTSVEPGQHARVELPVAHAATFPSSRRSSSAPPA